MKKFLGSAVKRIEGLHNISAYIMAAALEISIVLLGAGGWLMLQFRNYNHQMAAYSMGFELVSLAITIICLGVTFGLFSDLMMKKNGL